MQSIKVFGKNYKINRVDGFEDPLELGNTDYEGTINIKNFKDKDFERETILHETIHCIDDALGLDLTEKQVTAISSALYCIYKENQINITGISGE